MTIKNAHNLARYIMQYIDYELTEHNRVFHVDMIKEATEAYLGGAR